MQMDSAIFSRQSSSNAHGKGLVKLHVLSFGCYDAV